jgi:hypothetical protein
VPQKNSDGDKEAEHGAEASGEWREVPLTHELWAQPPDGSVKEFCHEQYLK